MTTVADAMESRLGGAMPRPRMLVIDDDKVHRMMICKIGEKTGYEVAVASSVDEAVDCLDRQRFHCVSLDLSLAGQSGISILGDIARKSPAAGVVIVSGASADVQQDALLMAQQLELRVGVSSKPINLPELRAKLTEFGQSKAVMYDLLSSLVAQ